MKLFSSTQVTHKVRMVQIPAKLLWKSNPMYANSDSILKNSALHSLTSWVSALKIHLWLEPQLENGYQFFVEKIVDNIVSLIGIQKTMCLSM
ncbi:UNVERIFIED_CONTAM: hypothetical protein NCL1_25059 [Trichonephila clavipes]